MEHKGKPINSSVPSIAIRFHANAEELEELYASEEEQPDKQNDDKNVYTPSVVSEPDSSPLRSYLPRLVKRSSSIDTSTQSASPPSDTWRFFSDIKGKITKSVEDKITEIKSRNQENEGSPHASKLTKDKENSSFSDSEDLSESSLSKTCGIISTTEGVELSSDDDTPSIEKDKKEEVSKNLQSSEIKASNCDRLRQRFKILRNKKTVKDNSVSIQSLSSIYEINTGMQPSTSQDNPDEIESGVEVQEDTIFQSQTSDSPETNVHNNSSFSDLANASLNSSKEHLAKNLAEQIDNIEVDADNVITVKQVSGTEIRSSYFENRERIVFSPIGFVDVRSQDIYFSWTNLFYVLRHFIIITLALVIYFWISLPIYINGFIAGCLFTFALCITYNKFFGDSSTPRRRSFSILSYSSLPILEVPAAKEYQPVTKFEGWMNEYPDQYDPHTYHISQTQSVYLRLQGNLLRISHTRTKIPKRAMWNEPKRKAVFTQHRIYNLLGAKITLLPERLNKKRHWSKKYPICITFNADQMNFDFANFKSDSEENLSNDSVLDSDSTTDGKRKTDFPLNKKKTVRVQPQVFSKLTEEDEYDCDGNSQHDVIPTFSSTKLSPDASEDKNPVIRVGKDDPESILEDEDDIVTLPDDWTTFTPEDSPTETNVYLFGRTDREKEDWFRRLKAATHKGAQLAANLAGNLDPTLKASISDALINAAAVENEYLRYMAKFHQFPKRRKGDKTDTTNDNASDNNTDSTSDNDKDLLGSVLWVNTLIARILFDCTHDSNFITRVKERIQRKLSAIKLPYFIEELLVSELSLGNTPPLIQKASKPVIDERGMWIDLDITYEGLVVLILQTKLNLMKLKQPRTNAVRPSDDSHSAMFHSDVDDTAESSSDDDAVTLLPSIGPLDASGYPVAGLGGTSNTSKKFIKMVDKIAESKFFQTATENRYIKRAMEGVSNTDLGLRVEIKGLIGTLVLNIPPPPSDRVWLGFRPVPKLWLTAQPIVGEKNISFMYVTRWIEKKLSTEFHKIMVIPNMEDITIPVMSPKLPD